MLGEEVESHAFFSRSDSGANDSIADDVSRYDGIAEEESPNDGLAGEGSASDGLTECSVKSTPTKSLLSSTISSSSYNLRTTFTASFSEAASTAAVR